ncbi:MAG: STT3 domain-containing protein [Candidatus Omnitrophica bacterium]|nr:STT3 domain-containing protein [Candidatus Omnitrophota bacterium]MDD5237195.1 STT3 domain-containing protein [Candidatus Omnitrophota bacterium]MDD5610891.1 STT3 domain-containing protein [Candidatus Omnitrophota bacterium]
MKRYYFIFLLSLAIGINIYFRLQTLALPTVEIKAKATINNQLLEEARKHINAKFKDLSSDIRVGLTKDLLDIWTKEKGPQLEKSIATREKELRQYFEDEHNNVFLLELDPYHWLRLTRNFVNTGRIGDEVVDGRQYDSYMLAPRGMPVEVSLHKNLHVYIAGSIYKILHLFKKDIQLVQVAFFMPVLISILGLILLFFMCRGLTGNSIAGFFACLSLGLAPIFLMRSMAGWFDTDPYVILFSILIIWGYLYSLRKELPSSKRLLILLATGLCTGLFSFTWDGWWYIFDLIIVSTLYYLANLYLLRKEYELGGLIKKTLFALGIFFSSALFFTLVLSGPKIVLHFATAPSGVFHAFQEQFWPNTFLTVAELTKGNPMEILSSLGGIIILFVAVAYLLWVLADKKSPDFIEKSFLGIFFSFWLIVLYMVSLKARRFGLLLAVPLCISFGLFIEKFYQYLNNILLANILKARLKRFCLFFALSLVPFAIFLNNAVFTKNIVPLLNKDWYTALNKIKDQTPKNAIINTWWDYGHWFKAIAERRVIFDGATQNTPMAYWMGRVFLTDDPVEAAGILRMLNSGSNRAFEKLEHLGFAKLDCLKILGVLAKLDKKEGEKFLAKYVPVARSRDELIKYIYNPEPAYFVVESSLIAKIKPISFLGGWDFIKADIYQAYKRMKKASCVDYMIKRHGYSKEQASDTYGLLTLLSKSDVLDWISPYLNVYSESANYRKEANTLYFDNGSTVDLSNYNTLCYSLLTGQWQRPRSIFYATQEGIAEKIFDKSEAPYSVILVNEGDKYKFIALDTKLARSMLVRLYYFKGKGLKYFKLFLEQDLKDRGKILVYKISWDGQ